MATLQQQKCPCCGGNISFDTDSQNLKCPYCDTEFDIAAMQQEQENDTEQPDTFAWDAEEIEWASDETKGMHVYACQSCGGEIIADETTGATSCPYCDSPVILKGQFEGDLRPHLIIPFKYDKQAAKDALKKHISSKKFIPAVFKDENHLDEIKGVYVPHWLFSGQAVASANFDATRVRTFSDAKYNYTETQHFSVHRSGNLAFSHVPVDGAQKMDDTLMESIEPFDVSQAVDFRTEYLNGFLADKYDVTVEQCKNRANERIKASAVDELSASVNGYSGVVCKSSNMQVANGSYKYALYPVWLLNTTWEGKKYTFAMNGQTGKFVGDLPVDKKAVWKRIALLTPILSAVAYAGFWLAQYL